jgi:hypothetical protein
MSDADPTSGRGGSLPPHRKAALRAVRWCIIPVLIGGGLLVALIAGALLGGVRDAVLLAAVTLGEGHLTIRPVASGGSAIGRGLIRESGAVYTNPALMRLPVQTGGQIAGRLVLPVEVVAKSQTGGAIRPEPVELIGCERPDDPQTRLLERFLVAGTWPGHDASGNAVTDDGAGIVLGASLAERLSLSVGDSVGVRSGSDTSLRVIRGRVAGIVRTGLPRIDEGRLWARAGFARNLLPLPLDSREEAVSVLAVYLERPEQAVEWLTAIRRYSLPARVEILTWRQVDPNALPWEPLILAQRRLSWIGFGAVGGGALVAALVAVWAARTTRRPGRATLQLGARQLVSLAGPTLLGLTCAVLVYGALWGWSQSVPLPAAQAFEWFDSALNPYGALTGPVRLNLEVGQALDWLGTSLCVYVVVSAVLIWISTRLRKP